MFKGIIEWLKPSVKMKRWLFLIMASTVLICFSVSKIITTTELQIIDALEVILLLLIGFIGIIIGFTFAQRRVLEILVESTLDTSRKKKADVKSLVFNRKVYDKGPKIVVIGGGTGLSTMLRGLKQYTNNITAVVTTGDDGNNTGILRRELGIVAPGDIRQCIVALSNSEPIMEELFQYRFDKGTLNGMNFGNMYLAAMGDICKNFADGVRKTSEVLAITGKVLPVTLDNMNVCAELEDGTIVEGESSIPEAVKSKITKIKRLFINPTNCMPIPEVITAIKQADAIILGPGSLYTSIMPNLLVRNVSKAVKEANGMKVYVCNVMTQPGETDNYTVSEHIEALQKHFGKDIIDFCICDSGQITPEFVKRYNLDGSEPVHVDYEKIKAQEVSVIEEDLSAIKDNHIRHDSDKLAKTIMELICEDFKLRNKQNLVEYAILKYKLKLEDMKIKREKARREKNKSKKPVEKIKERELNRRKESKFTEKYKQRIESIKNSDRK